MVAGVLAFGLVGCGSDSNDNNIESGETISDYNVKFISDNNELVGSSDNYIYALVNDSLYVENKTLSNSLDSFSSDDALSYCSNLSYTYKNTWRLPTRGELDVITNITLDKNVFNYQGSRKNSTYYTTTTNEVSYICRNGGLSCGFGGTGPKMVICVKNITN